MFISLQIYDLKPLTDVASNWAFLDVICSLQGATTAQARCCYHLVVMVYLQQFICNGILAMLIFIQKK